jgi:hypothetical protein
LDVHWFPVVAQHGWLALSHNKHQRREPLEIEVAMRAGLALFHLIGKLKHAELVEGLVLTMPRVIAFRHKHAPPFIASVYRPERKTAYLTVPGRVTMHLSHADWLKARRK